jgi:hypothetical protein
MKRLKFILFNFIFTIWSSPNSRAFKFNENRNNISKGIFNPHFTSVNESKIIKKIDIELVSLL